MPIIGIFASSSKAAPSQVNYFMIGGGASGAKGTPGACYGAGGGAGGYRESTFNPTTGTTYTITIGGGGAGSASTNSKADGVDTTGFSLTAGKGLGGFSGPGTTGNGGSSGSPQNHTSASYTVQPSTGGAGAAGNITSFTGGAGVESSITGTATFYGGGGGGSSDAVGYAGGSSIGGNGASGNSSSSPAPTSGAQNTGSGGGSMRGDDAAAAGSGGSGVFIVSYPNYYSDATVTGSPTFTNVGGNKIYKFTGSGSITF
jgi:hypothetical protein